MKVGDIVKGKVSKILKFGAIVDIEGGEKGFIHISKISKSFVKNVEDYLKEGQEISAKVIGRSRNGGWELSLKDAEAPEKVETSQTNQTTQASQGTQERTGEEKPKDLDFEKKLSKFLKESNQRLAEYRKRVEKKGRRCSW